MLVFESHREACSKLGRRHCSAPALRRSCLPAEMQQGSCRYPSSLAERQRYAGILQAELDQQAALVLVMAPAREEAIEHLVVSLSRIVSGRSARLVVRQDPNGGRFSVVFGEDTSIQTTLQADDGASYQPRSGDEIAWQFICVGKLPDLNASIRGCYDMNYGYLMANSAKRPLESAQGRYVFQGTRSTRRTGCSKRRADSAGLFSWSSSPARASSKSRLSGLESNSALP